MSIKQSEVLIHKRPQSETIHLKSKLIKKKARLMCRRSKGVRLRSDRALPLGFSLVRLMWVGVLPTR